MILDQNRIFDGFSSLAAGQDSGRNPSLIEKNQFARGENIVSRGGDAGTRPGIRSHSLTWERRNMTYLANGQFGVVDGVGAVPDESVRNFTTGKFQDASYFVPHGTPACLMVSVGGRLYQMRPKGVHGFKIAEIQMPYRNRANMPRAYMQQADKFHITQDGESKPIIFDGATARRAKDNEVPVGKEMAYGMGRLVVAVRNRELTFGDLYGSNDGTDPGDAVIMFTEATFLNEGFNAAIAFTLGEITGLHFAPQQDSAVGDGELLAFSENGVSSFFLSQPREQWKDSAFQRVTLLNIGGRGHDMVVSFNGDLWFRSDDGWRSYRQARAEIQGWAHLPMSTEVRAYMDADTARLLQYGSAINFGSRLISTCTPRTNQTRLYHNGLIALDFDVLSTFGQATRPAWDGHWSKLKFLKLVTGKFDGVNRAFAFALDADGRNAIYELTENDADDWDGPIAWQIETRSMDFNSPFNEKKILGGDIWIDDVSDSTTISAFYKCDQQPDWQTWQTLDAISKTGTCQEITCGGVPTVRKGYFPRKTLIEPTDAPNSQTNRNARRCFEFQAKLTGVGRCKIKRFRVSAHQILEDGKALV